MGEINIKELTHEQRENIKEQLKQVEQQTKWKGKHGIWSSFRNIGKEFGTTSNKEVNETDKKDRLKTEIENFTKERLKN